MGAPFMLVAGLSSQTTRAQLPIEIIDLILQMRYDSPDVLKVRRSKLRNYGMYCQFHSECVVVKDGVKAVSHGEIVCALLSAVCDVNRQFVLTGILTAPGRSESRCLQNEIVEVFSGRKCAL
jgi:hypothetical protein